MLILENLRKTGNRIFADFYFPGTEVREIVVFDVQKKEIEEIDCGGRISDTIYGLNHLVRVLRMMVENNKYPQTYEYYWY